MAVLIPCSIAIIIATVLHCQKKNVYDIEDKIDLLAKGCKRLDGVVPPNTNLSLYVYNDNMAYLWCRYLLAYPYGVYDKGYGKTDTVVSILGLNTNDSVIHALTNDRRVIRVYQDASFRYYITSKNK